MSDSLAIPGQLTPTSWSPPAEWTYEQAESTLRVIATMNAASRWWIGDALLAAEDRWGETYAQLSTVVGLEPGTLANIVSVCKRVAPSRRREELSFAHHAAVAALSPDDQVAWLEDAEESHWSVSALRDAVKAATGGTASAVTTERVMRAVDRLREIGVPENVLEPIVAWAQREKAVSPAGDGAWRQEEVGSLSLG